MCRPCIRLYKIEEDQAVGSSQIRRIDQNFDFLNLIVETVLFSLYEQMNELYVFPTVIEDLLEVLDLQHVADGRDVLSH